MGRGWDGNGTGNERLDEVGGAAYEGAGRRAGGMLMPS